MAERCNRTLPWSEDWDFSCKLPKGHIGLHSDIPIFGGLHWIFSWDEKSETNPQPKGGE